MEAQQTLPQEHQPDLNFKARLLGAEGLCIILTILILVIRKSDSFFHPQLWAEDATVFLKDALLFNSASIYLPNGGYYFIYQRLVALLALHFPVSWAPAIFNLGSLLAFLSVILLICSQRIILPKKYLLILSLVLAPTGTEVFMTLSSSHWFLLLTLILVCLSEDATSFPARILEFCVVLLAAFSGPNCLIALPLFLIRSYLRKSPATLSYTLIIALACVLTVKNLDFSQAAFKFSTNPTYYLHGLSNLLGFVLIGSAGKPGSEVLFQVGIIALLVLMFSYVFYLQQRYKDLTILIFAVAFVCVLVQIALKFSRHLDLFENIGTTNLARYSYVLSVLWIWQLLYVTHHRPILQPVILLPLLMIFLFVSGNFFSPPYVDLKWSQYAYCFKSGSYCSIPINPPPWILEINRPGKASIQVEQSTSF